jgi:hypothetical protein
MDLLSHVFLPLILLAAIGKLKAALSDFKDRGGDCFSGKVINWKIIRYCGRYFSSARLQRAKAVELLRECIL